MKQTSDKFIFLLILMASKLPSQVPFANIFQVPLLLNSSFVGNKDMHRCIAAYNQNSSSDYMNKSYHFSYDNFSNKHGLAYGAYLLMTDQSRAYQKEDYASQTEYFDHKILKQARPVKNVDTELGVVLGLKYNLNRKKGRESSTFSTSLGIGLNNEQCEYISGFGRSTMVVFDTLREELDSMYYKHQVAQEHHFNTQVGAKYNTLNFTLMYRFAYSLGYVLERHYEWSTISYTTFMSEQIGRSLTETSYYNHRFEHRLTAGYTIPKKLDVKYSASFMASIGVVKYTKSAKQNFLDSDNYRDKQSMPRIAHGNASALFRYRKILASLAFTKYTAYTTYGLGVGLQGKHYRFITSFFPKAKNYNSSFEMILALFW
jgi:hypothetical protein